MMDDDRGGADSGDLEALMKMATPALYHSSERFRAALQRRRGREMGDARAIASLLQDGLRSELSHPYHQQLLPVIWPIVLGTLPESVARHSDRLYTGVDGRLYSMFNEDRFMGPLSLVKDQFHCGLTLRCDEGEDVYGVTYRFEPDEKRLVVVSEGFEDHELASEYVCFTCESCLYTSALRILSTERTGELQEACPVCGIRVDRRTEVVPRVVGFSDLIETPRRYHLCLITVSGLLATGFEYANLLHPDTPQDAVDEILFPELHPEPAWKAVACRGAIGLNGEELPGRCRRVEDLTGVFLSRRDRVTDPALPGLVTSSPREKHWDDCEADLQVSRVSGARGW